MLLDTTVKVYNHNMLWLSKKLSPILVVRQMWRNRIHAAETGRIYRLNLYIALQRRRHYMEFPWLVNLTRLPKPDGLLRRFSLKPDLCGQFDPEAGLRFKKLFFIVIIH